jgi:hypothetical protein
MARALAGQADVNSTELRKLRGAWERGMGRKPKRAKKRSAVSVNKYASAAPSSRESSRAVSVRRLPRPVPRRSRVTATERSKAVGPKSSRAALPTTCPLAAGDQGGREVVFEPVGRQAGLLE